MGPDFDNDVPERRQDHEILPVKIHPRSSERLMTALKEAGCKVEEKQGYIAVTYPEGVKQSPEGLSTRIYRTRLAFPNGTVLIETWERFRQDSAKVKTPRPSDGGLSLTREG